MISLYNNDVLVDLRTHLLPDDASQIDGQACTELASAIDREKDWKECLILAEKLAIASALTNSAKSQTVCTKAMRKLIPDLLRIPATEPLGGMAGPDASWVPVLSGMIDPALAQDLLMYSFDRCENVYYLHGLASALVSTAKHKGFGEALKVRIHVVDRLVDVLVSDLEADNWSELTGDVVSAAADLDGTKASESVQRRLGGSPPEPGVSSSEDSSIWRALTILSKRMSPSDSVLLLGHAAKMYATELDREVNSNARSVLAQGLVQLAGLTDQQSKGMLDWSLSNALADAVVRETGTKLRSAMVSLTGTLDVTLAVRFMPRPLGSSPSSGKMRRTRASVQH